MLLVGMWTLACRITMAEGDSILTRARFVPLNNAFQMGVAVLWRIDKCLRSIV